MQRKKFSSGRDSRGKATGKGKSFTGRAEKRSTTGKRDSGFNEKRKSFGAREHSGKAPRREEGAGQREYKRKDSGGGYPRGKRTEGSTLGHSERKSFGGSDRSGRRPRRDTGPGQEEHKNKNSGSRYSRGKRTEDNTSGYNKKRTDFRGGERTGRPPRRGGTDRRAYKSNSPKAPYTKDTRSNEGSSDFKEKRKASEGENNRPYRGRGKQERENYKGTKGYGERKPHGRSSRKPEGEEEEKKLSGTSERSFPEKEFKSNRGPAFKKGKSSRKKDEREEAVAGHGEGIRLNRFIANAGISSRRDADKFIRTGVVTVNGKVITEMGYRVKETDIVRFGDRSIKPEKPVYVVLNKPKDFITTMDDPRGRNIVTSLINIKERVFPVGRLDRNTTGVLLLTNDGDLGERLMHPRYNVSKIYLAILDKNLKSDDIEQLKTGVELEDGTIAFDDVAYAGDDKKTIGVQIHSGRNRIIHRTFEQLGYKVDKLDRTSYAGLTKKDLKRGDWRYLTALEVIELKKLVKLKGKY